MLRFIKEIWNRYKQCNVLPLRFRLLKTVRIGGVTYPEGVYWYHIHEDFTNETIYRHNKRKDYYISLKLYNKFREMKILELIEK